MNTNASIEDAPVLADAVERAINFPAVSISALLKDRKTQDRRTVKRRDGERPVDFMNGMFWFGDGDTFVFDCPYGKAGDKLWVRESWLPCCHGSYEAWPRNGGTPVDAQQAFIQYKADAAIDEYKSFWRSPAQMPRWASRIMLEVTGVHVERLTEISRRDCVAEGIGSLPIEEQCMPNRFEILIPESVRLMPQID